MDLTQQTKSRRRSREEEGERARGREAVCGRGGERERGGDGKVKTTVPPLQANPVNRLMGETFAMSRYPSGWAERGEAEKRAK